MEKTATTPYQAVRFGSIHRAKFTPLSFSEVNDFSRRDVEDDRSASPRHPFYRRLSNRPVPVLILLISIGLEVYAITRSFVWDEGFHLLAAQMINAGKKPYIDFCFPQTPLNAYWNAVWMELFGQSWRVTHTAAALLVIGTLVLVGNYVMRYFRFSRWRSACGVVAVLLFGLNPSVVEFGTISQAYAMCLFTAFVGFLFATEAVERNGSFLPLLAGFFAGAAAGSSLLGAPVACVLLVWILLQNRLGSRKRKAIAFLAGSCTAFIPVFWLFAQAPHQVFFNIVEYQALFRRVDWAGATTHDLDVLTSWVDSGVALLLSVLSTAGLLFAARNTILNPRVRRELFLCGWISLALILYISTAHPTFSRYYVVTVPFLAVLAAPGFYFTGTRLFSPEKPLWPAFCVALIVCIAMFRAMFNDRDSATWQRYGQIAQKVASVTPQTAKLFADEQVYFLLNRLPPSGMEFSYSHKLQLSHAEEAMLHIISEKQLEAEVKAGVYPTLQTCNDDRIDDWGLANVYKQRADIADCSVFWDYRTRVKP